MRTSVQFRTRAPAPLLAAAILTLILGACSGTPASPPPPPLPPFEFVTQWGNPGDGPGQLARVTGIAVDSRGLVYLSDAGNNFIHKFDSAGSPLYAFQDPLLKSPAAIGIDRGGAIYVADAAGNQCFIFFPDGKRHRAIRGPATLRLSQPAAVAVNDFGQIYIAEAGANRIQAFSALGRLLHHWGKKGSADGEFDSPAGIAAGPDGSLYVADRGNRRIQKFRRDGSFVAAWPVAASASSAPGEPHGIAASDRYLFVTEPATGSLHVFTLDGRHLHTESLASRLTAAEAHQLVGVAVTSSGLLFALDGAGRVLSFRLHLP